MFKFKKILIIFLLIFNIFLVSGLTVSADEGFLPATGNYEYGDYTLNEMVSVIVIFSNWLLSIVGSLALLMFVYGGVLFLISAGNSEQVKKGQQIILGAIIGIVIVFTSHAIIELAFTALNIDTGAGWSTSGWFNPK